MTTADLAHELASEYELTWRQQVHLEAALTGLQLDLEMEEDEKFLSNMRKFLEDVFDNVCLDEG